MVLFSGSSLFGRTRHNGADREKDRDVYQGHGKHRCAARTGANEFCREASYVTRCLDRREHGQRQELERGIMPSAESDNNGNAGAATSNAEARGPAKTLLLRSIGRRNKRISRFRPQEAR